MTPNLLAVVAPMAVLTAAPIAVPTAAPIAVLMAADWRPRTDLNRHDQVRSLTSYPLDDEGQCR